MIRSTKKQNRGNRITTTLGSLLSAAYEVSGQEPRRAAAMLERGELGRLLVGAKLKFL
ncbi:MAG: hypothetical protein JST54_14255 [Deltaproteobacteria bacterium]|nr:hypothetical protein [Deltaproteobacteria bacterium]